MWGRRELWMAPGVICTVCSPSQTQQGLAPVQSSGSVCAHVCVCTHMCGPASRGGQLRGSLAFQLPWHTPAGCPF